jgi:hypothetical protein
LSSWIISHGFLDDDDTKFILMQACQFYGFSGFVLEKGKDLNLARLAASEDWVRQDQEEVLEDDEVDSYA